MSTAGTIDRGRLIEPVAIDPMRAQIKITEALRYYQVVFGLSDEQIVAVIWAYRTSKKDVSDGRAEILAGDIIKAYENGADLDLLASRTGMSTIRIGQYIVAAGGTIRPRGGVKKTAWGRGERVGHRGVVDPTQIDAYLAAGEYDKAYLAGLSLRELCAAIQQLHHEHVGIPTMASRLRKAGVQLRPPRGGYRQRADETDAEFNQRRRILRARSSQGVLVVRSDLLPKPGAADNGPTGDESATVIADWILGQRVAHTADVDPTRIDAYLKAGDFDKAYLAGAALRDISVGVERYHNRPTAPKTVRKWLRQAGVSLRPPHRGYRQRRAESDAEFAQRRHTLQTREAT